jgi:hypothetical protein
MRLLVCLNLIMIAFHFDGLQPGFQNVIVSKKGDFILVQDTDHRKLIEVDGKVYIDTVWSSTFNPDSIFVYYYSVRSKYPESSESICQEAARFLKETAVTPEGSGYITFRFFIDSTGKLQKRVQVLQTSESYKNYRFNEHLVWILFDYLQSLKQWKPSRMPVGYPPFYIGIMTFKIHEGNLVAVIP